jgi:hypothetical protein
MRGYKWAETALAEGKRSRFGCLVSGANAL